MLSGSISFPVLGGSAATDAGPEAGVTCFTSLGSTDFLTSLLDLNVC